MKRALMIGGIGLLALSAVLLTTGLIQFIITPTFESVARISIQPEPSSLPSTSQADGKMDISNVPWFQTEVERLQSRMVLYQVITNLNLNRTWGEKFKEGELSTDLTYALLKRQIHLRPARGTALLEIRVRSDDPMEAAAIANAIAAAYRTLRTSSPLVKSSAVEMIDRAEPDLRPVKPNPLMKILVPAAGLLAGILGLILLMLAVMTKVGARKSPPPLPA
jgi:capsular polysaccharide biosynthesis protein